MTNADIEKLLFERVSVLCSSGVVDVNGKVYYKGTRPITTNPSTNKEDVVISILSAKGTDLIEGNCLVNIYVQDILVPSGVYMENKVRTLKLSQELDTLAKALNHIGNVFYERIETVAVVENDETNEHIVSLKLRFRALNDNY